MKLPRSPKEFALFIAIISIISVNIIAPLISFFEAGFTTAVWRHTYQVMPFIWLTVVALVLLTLQPAQIVTGIILQKEDSFRAHMIVNALVNVLMMSIVLSVVATWIGTQSFTFEPITHFFYRWPRNFAIALGIEMLVAQPFARYVMYKMHVHLDANKIVQH
ncbi:MAG: hypothetical protein LBT80_07780 [Lactobacillaceae bacterium]|nr:hypothetical protein [Lactobacillaceae bacterium]